MIHPLTLAAISFGVGLASGAWLATYCMRQALKRMQDSGELVYRPERRR